MHGLLWQLRIVALNLVMILTVGKLQLNRCLQMKLVENAVSTLYYQQFITLGNSTFLNELFQLVQSHLKSSKLLVGRGFFHRAAVLVKPRLE